MVPAPPLVPAQRSATEPPADDGARLAAQPRPRRLRPVLTVLGGVLALLLIGTVGIVYVVYERATAIDRSAPDVVVDNFLRALFADRDRAKAKLWACSSTGRLGEILSMQEDLDRREHTFQAAFNVTWGELAVLRKSDDKADVVVELKLSAMVDGFAQNDLQTWRFETEDEDGWRVCGATRVS